MERNYIFITALVVVLFIVVGQEGCELPSPKECELSLCDCECHFKGQTPEAIKGVLCGINCYDLHNISGCKYENGSCVIVYRNAGDNSSSSPNLASIENNPESSGCGCGH